MDWRDQDVAIKTFINHGLLPTMGWQSLWQSLVNWNINNNNILKKLISILFWYFLVISTIISTIIPTIYRDGIKICCLVDIMLPYSWSRLKNNINYNWLVVEPTPQLGLLFPTEWKNKSHVPNHQPDNINYDINFSHGFPKIQWIGCRQKKWIIVPLWHGWMRIMG